MVLTQGYSYIGNNLDARYVKFDKKKYFYIFFIYTLLITIMKLIKQGYY